MATLVPDNVDLKTETTTRGTEEHFTNIKWSIF